MRRELIIIAALLVGITGCRTPTPQVRHASPPTPSAGDELIAVIQDAANAIKSDPDGLHVPATRLRQADALTELGRFADALRCYRDVISRPQATPEILKRAEQGISHCEQVMNRHKNR